MTTNLPTSYCPECGYELDSATCAYNEKASPSPGDLSVCLNCGEILEFNEILVLHKMPGDLKLPTAHKAIIEEAVRIIKERGRIHPPPPGFGATS